MDWCGLCGEALRDGARDLACHLTRRLRRHSRASPKSGATSRFLGER